MPVFQQGAFGASSGVPENLSVTSNPGELFQAIQAYPIGIPVYQTIGKQMLEQARMGSEKTEALIQREIIRGVESRFDYYAFNGSGYSNFQPNGLLNMSENAAGGTDMT